MDIQSVKTKILTILDANKGRTSFDTVKNGLDYQEQRLMIRALRAMKADGVAQKQNRIVDGKPVFEVFRIGAPIPTVQPQSLGS